MDITEIREMCDKILKDAKDWFKNITEADIDLMINCGVITQSQLLEMYYNENKIPMMEYDSLITFTNTKEEYEQQEKILNELKELAKKYKISIITNTQKGGDTL